HVASRSRTTTCAPSVTSRTPESGPSMRARRPRTARSTRRGETRLLASRATSRRKTRSWNEKQSSPRGPRSGATTPAFAYARSCCGERPSSPAACSALKVAALMRSVFAERARFRNLLLGALAAPRRRRGLLGALRALARRFVEARLQRLDEIDDLRLRGRLALD